MHLPFKASFYILVRSTVTFSVMYNGMMWNDVDLSVFLLITMYGKDLTLHDRS